MASSWRETTSQAAQDQVGLLVDGAFGTAQRLLGESGDFAPFAVALPTGGPEPEVVQFEGAQGGADAAAVDAALEHLKGRRDELDAYALVINASAVGSDAISVQLEHREGAAVAVLQPYRRKKLGRRFEFSDDLVSQDGDRHVWG